MQFSVPVPSQYAALSRGKMPQTAHTAPFASSLNSAEVSFCEDILTYARTHFARAERVVA